MIELNDAAAAILRDVEERFGRGVVIDLVDFDEAFLYGACEILEDGTPRVRIRRDGPNHAATLVHELLHLRLRHDGVPTDIGTVSTAQFDYDVANRLMGELREILCHFCFFPEIRALGYDPSANLQIAVRSQIDSGALESISERWWPIHHGRFILELDHPALLAEGEDRIQRRGFGLDKGRALACMVRDSDPCDAQAFVNLLVACANLVSGNQCQFSFYRWTHVQRGDFRDPVAQLRIEIEDGAPS